MKAKMFIAAIALFAATTTINAQVVKKDAKQKTEHCAKECKKECTDAQKKECKKECPKAKGECKGNKTCDKK